MRLIVPVSLAALLATASLAAQGWPQWRGPARDATVAAADAPAAWPAAFARAWRVDVGEGYASPVVGAGLVFVHTRKDPQEVVTAVDARTGAVKWQQSYSANFTKNQYASKMAKGPNATPLLAGPRLYTLGASGHLIAWDVAGGKQLWMQDYSPRIDTSKLFCGTAASPIIVDGRLIVQVGSDVRNGSVLALDAASGKTIWEWKGPGPGYATPVPITIGKTSMLVAMTNSSIVGINSANGTQLWTVPFPDEWHENIVTPIWTGSELIVSGIRQGTHAYRLSEKGGAWSAAEAWKNADVAMYMSTPVVADGLIYGLSYKRKGQFVAVDVKTGVTKWATEGREAEHASALLLPRHVVFLTNAGALVVAKRSATGFEAEKKYELAGSSETWALPVFVGGDLIVKDATGLARLAAK